MFSFFRRKKKPAPAAVPTPAEPEPEAAVARPASADATLRAPVAPAVPPDPPEIAALRARPAEDLCGITPAMTGNEIRLRLAQLFRRHNRAASSLDEQLRAEAEIMLRAIVEIRHRFLESEPDGSDPRGAPPLSKPSDPAPGSAGEG